MEIGHCLTIPTMRLMLACLHILMYCQLGQLRISQFFVIVFSDWSSISCHAPISTHSISE